MAEITIKQTVYDTIASLDESMQLSMYNAVMEYCFFGIHPEFTGPAAAIFKLLRPKLQVVKQKKEYSPEEDAIFESFWNTYDKKVGDKEKIKAKFCRLSTEDKVSIAIHVPKYVKAQPDKKFRKNPETYLNNKSWNDEIVYEVPLKQPVREY